MRVTSRADGPLPDRMLPPQANLDRLVDDLHGTVRVKVDGTVVRGLLVPRRARDGYLTIDMVSAPRRWAK